MERDDLRDGFADAPDEGLADRAILPELNAALAILGQAGFNQSDITIATVAGTMEYAIPTTTTKIEDVQYNDSVGGTGYKSLVNVTLTELNARTRGKARTTTPRVPNVFVNMAQTLILWPPPNGVGPVKIKGDSAPVDLVNSTDVPATLPVIYHEAVAILAGMLIVGGGGLPDQSVYDDRMQFLLSQWQMQDKSLTDVIDVRAVVALVARPEGGEN